MVVVQFTYSWAAWAARTIGSETRVMIALSHKVVASVQVAGLASLLNASIPNNCSNDNDHCPHDQHAIQIRLALFLGTFFIKFRSIVGCAVNFNCRSICIFSLMICLCLCLCLESRYFGEGQRQLSTFSSLCGETSYQRHYKDNCLIFHNCSFGLRL